MLSDTMMQEVWRWKNEIARETAGMTSQELIVYYNRAGQRLADKTGGKKLNLPRLARPQRRRLENET